MLFLNLLFWICKKRKFHLVDSEEYFVFIKNCFAAIGVCVFMHRLQLNDNKEDLRNGDTMGLLLFVSPHCFRLKIFR